MAPKLSAARKRNEVTCVKFKRQKDTYVIAMNLKGKSVRLNEFKRLLCDVINGSGGIRLEEEPDEPEQLEELEDGLGDIEVPKSEFAEDIDIKTENDEGKAGTKLVNEGQIELAVPQDKTSPYKNEWVKLEDDTSISSITFTDFDIIAFSYDGEPFHIVEAVYND